MKVKMGMTLWTSWSGTRGPSCDRRRSDCEYVCGLIDDRMKSRTGAIRIESPVTPDVGWTFSTTRASAPRMSWPGYDTSVWPAVDGSSTSVARRSNRPRRRPCDAGTVANSTDSRTTTSSGRRSVRLAVDAAPMATDVRPRLAPLATGGASVLRTSLRNIVTVSPSGLAARMQARTSDATRASDETASLTRRLKSSRRVSPRTVEKTDLATRRRASLRRTARRPAGERAQVSYMAQR